LLLPVLVLVWLGVGGVTGPFAGRLSEVATNDSAAFLPSSAESTRAAEEQQALVQESTVPVIVLWESTDGPITAEQRAAAEQAVTSLDGKPGVAGRASPVLPSQDGAALQAVVSVQPDLGDELRGVLDSIHAAAEQVPGATVYLGGPAATQADLVEAFAGIDTILLAVALGVVLLILLLVYRSVLLPLVVISSAVLALALASAVVYVLADRDVVRVDGQVQGILFILVIGAATDYALLLSARYREELVERDRFTAMWRAVSRSFGPIVASAATVAAGLLALLLSDLANNRALGPVGAIGIACAVLTVLTFLPAALALLGRVAYWPSRPLTPEQARASRGVWGRVATVVSRGPRRLWVTCVVVLAAAAAMFPMLRADGAPLSETFVSEASSVTAQEALARHFPAGQGNPAVVVTDVSRVQQVVDVAGAVPGVSAVQPTVQRDGRALVQATLTDPSDSLEAQETVVRLREAVHGVDGANALVGGYAAQQYDLRTTVQRDMKVIIPVVLAIILVILIGLLRAFVAPVLLVATVALNFLATIGVSALVFRHLLDFTGVNPSVPLYGFVFLVALGVDYNIFLMTRVREEAQQRGTRRGAVAGLVATGGVITSAGVVLAATFAALVVIPLSFLLQLAFIVAFGVLLDTLVVRSLLVPALVVDIGSPVWWPSRLAREQVPQGRLRAVSKD